MPIYEYECEAHGVFEALGVMSEPRRPQACPECQTLAPRILSTVHIAGLPAAVRKAHAINEKSREAPHVCGSGCSHGHRSTKPAATGAPKTPRPQVARGGRPWVLEH
jgi:putative FmdB family regulatory protein